MRIATSSLYGNQAGSIDGLTAQYDQIGQTLSSGKSLNKPSDDPSQVSQALTLTNTIANENADASNASAASNQLTFTDTTLQSLTSLLSTARSLAVEGATDIIPNGSQRPLIGQQIAGLLNQALALANQQYGSTYIFSGTGSSTTPPITPLGSPPNNVVFTGNNQAKTTLINGQQVQVGTTMQAAFNLNSTDGTPSVFQLLATLRNTMTQEPASIQSQQPINVSNVTIEGAADANPTTLGTIAGPPALTTIPLTADNAVPPSYSIEIDGTNVATHLAGSAQFTFGPGAAVDDGTPNSVVGAINAQTANTGVTASWNVASQRLQLTSVANGSPPFLISDIKSQAGAVIIQPAPGVVLVSATTTSSFLKTFQIPSQVSVTSNLSTQIGDIDAVVNQVLKARSQIGQQIQNLAASSSQLTSLSNDNVTTDSTIADTNIAQATSQFTLVQTALQAAYAVTTRLEGKTLIDYL